MSSPDPSELSGGSPPQSRNRSLFPPLVQRQQGSSWWTRTDNSLFQIQQQPPAANHESSDNKIPPITLGPAVGADAAVLADADILREMDKGNVVIIPFKREHLNSCSYDVTLGPWFYRASRDCPYLNPWDAESVRRYWGKPLAAGTAEPEPHSSGDSPSGKSPHNEASQGKTSQDFGLPPGQAFFYLAPGETVLAHTDEFIGGRGNITTMLRARSSMGRCNVTVCRDAGWGDVGYVNRWTLQVSNQSGVPVILPVGARLAQIIFLYTGEPTCQYTGNYQNAASKGDRSGSGCAWLEQIRSAWTPASMLPKLASALTSFLRDSDKEASSVPTDLKRDNISSSKGSEESTDLAKEGESAGSSNSSEGDDKPRKADESGNGDNEKNKEAAPLAPSFHCDGDVCSLKPKPPEKKNKANSNQS
jgi:dCTP deaminase